VSRWCEIQTPYQAVLIETRPGSNTKFSLHSIRKACARTTCPASGTLQERLEGVWQRAMGATGGVENTRHMGRLEGLGLLV